MDLEQLGRENAQADWARDSLLSKQELFKKADEYKLGYLPVLCEYVCNHIDPLFCLDQIKEIQAIYDFPFAQEILSRQVHYLESCINA